ncbi:uncharacterized protein J8A68_000738 [[Candida] subhashii]|uniref:Transcription initiation factor TFIID subunit 12 domain-containing protein n=1 Tax=[Candida] subhashii TaxID=561895 RepID=A0A8J5UL38_9ASCO|nr:uncharacterized protein J8A68_000738 [[Candida] subhashii]KAG7665718.1 hypothetical protein J8A68_000738 [[Candida] subhashii]
MEGGSNSQRSTPTSSTPETEINQQKARLLVQKLKEEIQLAKASTDPAKAKAHYQVAEKIKRVLLTFQAQQGAKQQTNEGTPSSGLGSTPVVTPGGSIIQPPTINSGVTSSVASPSVSSSGAVSAIQSPSPQRSTPVPASDSNTSSTGGQKVTVEKFNQVKNRLKELYDKVKALESNRALETDESKKAAMEKEAKILTTQLQQFQKVAIYMKNQLVQQGRISGSTTPVGNMSSRSATPPISQDTSNKPPVPAATAQPILQPQPVAATTNTTTSSPAVKTEESNKPTKTEPTPKATPAATTKAKSATPSSAKTTTAPTPTATAAPPAPPAAVQRAMTTNSDIPKLKQAIASTTAATTTPANNTNRTTTTSSITSSTMPTLNRFASSLDMSSSSSTVTPANIPDNGGRVLTKRKLVELVNSIAVDQYGDTKTSVDVDVEDLFLDLADDFVRSVVGFSCRLAKHRKIDENKIDIRDLQLNLERNWGIRVPGYAMDEIKAVKKWQPNPEYVEKVKQIEKSENKERK